MLVQHSRWLGRGEQAQGQEQGQVRQRQVFHQHPAVVEQSQEECEVLELQRSGTLFQILSEEETEFVGCGELGATIIFWCVWRDDVERFLLVCFRERVRPEQLRIQDRRCLGDWHRQCCCEVGGCCWRDSWPFRREGQRNWSCAIGERVFDQGKQQILGIVDGKVRGLNMRVAQVKKSFTCVYDMCFAGHRVVFDFDSNKRDLSHAENKLIGETTYFKVRNRVWELEAKIIPKAETEDIMTKVQENNVEELCFFQERVACTLTVSAIDDPVGSGFVRDDREREGRGVMAMATAHHEVPVDHDLACEPSARHQSPRCDRRSDGERQRGSPCRGSCTALNGCLIISYIGKTICSVVVSPNCKIDSLSHFLPVIRWPARCKPPTTHLVVFIRFSMVGGQSPREDCHKEQFIMFTNVCECDGSSAFCFSYHVFVRDLPVDTLYEDISHFHISKFLCNCNFHFNTPLLHGFIF